MTRQKTGTRQQQQQSRTGEGKAAGAQPESVSEFSGDAVAGGNIAYGNAPGTSGSIIRDQDGPDGE
jgi:hypothetical protein